MPKGHDAIHTVKPLEVHLLKGCLTVVTGVSGSGKTTLVLESLVPSCNIGSLRCPTCDGTGQISLDVQFVPDVDIPCPDCQGSRYGKDAYTIRCFVEEEDQAESLNAYSLPEILSLTVDEVLGATVVVIEYDLDIIANVDYLIDMGPGSGESGGMVVCAGTPEEVCACEQIITGKFLKEVL